MKTIKKCIQYSIALACVTLSTNTFAGKLIQFSDLEYLGAFRVPQGEYGSPQYTGFNYGGTGLTYNPLNNSLFIVGHNWHQLVAEISIPQEKQAASLSGLNTAEVLQPFADITEGNRSNLGEGGVTVNTSGEPLGSFLVWDNKLIGTAYGYYDASSVVKLSHYISDLDLSKTGDFQGMYQVGETPNIPNPAFIDGYMAKIPQEWQDAFGGPALTGNCCLSIISRTSLGPAASVFDPGQLGKEDPVEATPVVGYPISNPTLGTYGDKNPNSLFNGSMSIKGMVFPDGSQSVLFFGRRGRGDFCYGHGVSNPNLHNTHCDPDYPTVLCCYDPVNGSKGGHSYPYVYMVLAYDAQELLKVKNGTKKMWDVLPYGVWEMTFPFANDNPRILGVAYDPLKQKIYIAQDGGDKPGCCGHLPLIQVYRLNHRDIGEGEVQPGVPLLLLQEE
jgi:hypothetical protein